MYTDKICHNSVLSDHIIFILGSLATFESTHNYLGTNCLPCQQQLPRNGAKNYMLYDQFDHVLLYCKHFKLVYIFTTRLLWRYLYYVN